METMEEMGKAAAAFTRAALKAGFRVRWRSGGCWKGPDQILFLLADIFKDDPNVLFTVYLPDDKKMWLTKRHPNIKFIVPEITEKVREVVRELHAAPDNLKEEHYRLHGRNLFIVAGDTLESPADVVYFAAPERADGIVRGGTAMGVSYARKLSVPSFNAFLPTGMNDFIRYVRRLLQVNS